MEKLGRKTCSATSILVHPKALPERAGNGPRLQLNDQLADVEDIAVFVEAEKEKMPDENRAKIIMALKVDKEVNVGIISDVKTELRKANALKLTYITNKRMEEN